MSKGLQLRSGWATFYSIALVLRICSCLNHWTQDSLTYRRLLHLVLTSNDVRDIVCKHNRAGIGVPKYDLAQYLSSEDPNQSFAFVDCN